MSFVDAMPWLASPWQQWQRSRDTGRLGHALLLQGEEGLGKGRLAAEMAANLLCEQGIHCGRCKGCRLLQSGHHPDHILIQPEGLQIKVDTVRALIATLTGTAHQGGSRVVVIEQAERLNGASANALLKTLEEPMPGVYLILVSAIPSALPATIVSRCQRLNVPSATPAQLKTYLGEGAQALPDWPYWTRLVGGPMALKKALAQGTVDQVERWRLAWQQSLEQGFLAPELASVESDKGAIVLKVLYFELMCRGRNVPESLAVTFPVMQELLAEIRWLEQQSGVNLQVLCQRFVRQLCS
ncbi:DNA polymerase III subunit delta' [Ferrimonas gelatinilytica]|uniref:DNA-directed DNA polymerase n=1 Tax=Ferrimonas gelatinilytica TaxID=1255257 RepID=A0ABP9RV76_9GAMM